MEIKENENLKLFAKYSGNQIEINVTTETTYFELKQIIEKGLKIYNY